MTGVPVARVAVGQACAGKGGVRQPQQTRAQGQGDGPMSASMSRRPAAWLDSTVSKRREALAASSASRLDRPGGGGAECSGAGAARMPCCFAPAVASTHPRSERAPSWFGFSLSARSSVARAASLCGGGAGWRGGGRGGGKRALPHLVHEPLEVSGEDERRERRAAVCTWQRGFDLQQTSVAQIFH